MAATRAVSSSKSKGFDNEGVVGLAGVAGDDDDDASADMSFVASL
jgi:hypothetical protein